MSFGIGIYYPKTESNIGTLWRSAYIFGAKFLFTIGHRYIRQCSDTVKAFRHIPLIHFTDFDDFRNHIPYQWEPVAIEINEKSVDLSACRHPQKALYVLGAEDYGIPAEILEWFPKVVSIDATPCLNVAVAGSIVMYDRQNKSKK